MSRRTRGWQWTPASTGNHKTGTQAVSKGATFEEEIQAMGELYWLKKQAKWSKMDPHRIKTRRGIISLPNPFLDFIGTVAPGYPLWFEAKSTTAPYLDISCSKDSRGLKESQRDIIRDQFALGARPFLLWEYRWKDQLLSKVMFIPPEVILDPKQEGRLKADDFPNIRQGRDILIVETFLKYMESSK